MGIKVGEPDGRWQFRLENRFPLRPCDALADYRYKAREFSALLASAPPDWLDRLRNGVMGLLLLLAYVGLFVLQVVLEQ